MGEKEYMKKRNYIKHVKKMSIILGENE